MQETSIEMLNRIVIYKELCHSPLNIRASAIDKTIVKGLVGSREGRLHSPLTTERYVSMETSEDQTMRF